MKWLRTERMRQALDQFRREFPPVHQTPNPNEVALAQEFMGLLNQYEDQIAENHEHIAAIREWMLRYAQRYPGHVPVRPHRSENRKPTITPPAFGNLYADYSLYIEKKNGNPSEGI